MNGPMQWLAPETHSGQLDVIGNTSAFASWANASISLGSYLDG